ncbi:MAG: carboxymuconolactone decarboxylase family protein, partial [Methanolinea sp.]
MAKDTKDLERMIGKVPKFFRELAEKDPQMFEMWLKREGQSWDGGALTRKTKKWMAIAIAASRRVQH